MKKVSLFAAMLAMASSCTVSEIDSIRGTTAPEITASFEIIVTKTTITTDDEGVGTIWWKPADEINVFYGTTSTHYMSKNKENATTVAFGTTDIIGSTESAQENIWGLYPYDEEAECDGESVTTTIPAVQQAIAGSFDDDIFTSLAHSTSTVMTFYNVLGGIKFSLSRNDIKCITFKGNNDEDIAGKVKLEMDANGKPVAEITEGEKTITLTPKEGTTFAKNTNYYIVMLPTILSNGFTMTFETEDKIGTFNYTDKAVTISRSKFGKKANIDTYANFEDKPAPATDLSAAGTANCYIVSSTGRYKFKTVQGNSSTSVGDVKGVKVLWETFGTNVSPSVGDLIKADVSFADNYITFSTNDTYKEGNAVIAAYSDKDCTDGNVLWSWHIWLTDIPTEQEYKNNAGIMMDRNLGATSATPGNTEVYGLIYQWGRKDPFLSATALSGNIRISSTTIWPDGVDVDNSTGTIQYATSHPMTLLFTSGSDWLYSGGSYNETRWSNKKTIYDPCPSGWKVPDGGDDGIFVIASGITEQVNYAPYDKSLFAMNFKDILCTQDCWFPFVPTAATDTYYRGKYNIGSNWSEYHTSSCTGGNYYEYKIYTFNMRRDDSAINTSYWAKGGSYTLRSTSPVRCQKIK